VYAGPNMTYEIAHFPVAQLNYCESDILKDSILLSQNYNTNKACGA